MILSENDKGRHVKLKKPTMGFWGRNECALLGANCADIARMVQKIQQRFPQYAIGYADADHDANQPFAKGTHVTVFANGKQVSYAEKENAFSPLFLFSTSDAVMVNGNHFEAQRQILIAHPEKEHSIRKRKAQITHPVAILLPEGVTTVPSYLLELTGDRRVPVFRESAEEEFFLFYQKTFLLPPVLKGLVLTGGKSLRMGQDKSRMVYFDQPQYMRVFQLLQAVTEEVWMACRDEQKDDFPELAEQIIADRILGIGPMGGLISAMMQDPDCAWLVVACDMPLLDEQVIRNLVEQRNPSSVATAYQNSETGYPEPLIAIWEPKSYQRLMNFIALGITCPKKVLTHSDITFLLPEHPEKLANINTPEEWGKLQNTVLKP